MSIDEPLELTQSNANHNTNINRTDRASNSNSEQLYSTSFAIPQEQAKEKHTEQKNSIPLSDASHNDNVPNSAKDADSPLSTNAAPAAKASANRENLGPKNSETLDEKKKKLTLSLVTPPSVGALSSISSDSNNHQFPVLVSCS